jgi:[ribosomal protein S5]-alanine N-acetyltransferase
MPLPIETERAILRPLDASDYGFMRQLHSNADVMKYIGGGVLRTEQQTRDALDKYLVMQEKAPLLGAWVAVLRETGEAVGNLILREPATPEPMEGLEVGFSFLPAHWGKGYATEFTRGIIEYAKKHFPGVKLVALVDPLHGASKGALMKAGFKSVKMGEYLDPLNGNVLPTEILEIA